MNTYIFFKWYEKLCNNPFNYIIAMTAYHIEILFFVTLLGLDVKTKTFLPMILPNEANGLSFLNYTFSFNFYSIFYSAMILLVDFAFLFIIKKEIKNYESKHAKVLPSYLHLTNLKILIIEIFVFYFSIGNPIMRASLYFFSFNTIQIYVIYRIVFNIYILGEKLFKPLLIMGAYISILRLAIYPLYLVAMSYYKIQYGT